MLVAICPVAVRWRLEMNIKPGDVAIFKNGEEAIVERTVKIGESHFKISFNKKVHGWIRDERIDYCWIYNRRGLINTGSPNGNDIVKVIQC